MPSLDEIAARFEDARQTRSGYEALCPICADQTASVSICNSEGAVEVHCSAGCDRNELRKFAGLVPTTESGLEMNNASRTVEAIYRYEDRTDDGTRVLLYERVCYGPKRFEIRQPDDGMGGCTGNLHDVAKHVLYRTPELIEADPNDVVFVCESEKEVLRLAAHGLVATCDDSGADQWRREYSLQLSGRHVVVLPSSNEIASKHAELVAGSLTGIAQSVKVVSLPGRGEMEDLTDFLEQSSIEELLSLCQKAPLWQTGTKSRTRGRSRRRKRPQVFLGPHEMRVNDKVIAALADDPTTFRQGDRLVEVLTIEGPPESLIGCSRATGISALTRPRLQEKLSNVVEFMAFSKTAKDYVPCHPPKWCVDQVFDRKVYPAIRPLEAVVPCPVLLPSGRVLQDEGYDLGCGILYLPDRPFPRVVESPTRDEAKSAAATLLDVVCDFPFATEAHRAAWLAALLTMFARFAYAGPTPLFLFDASTPGSGKGMLASVIAIISTGRDVPRTSMPRSDDEMRKRVTAIALSGKRLVLLDNVLGIDSPSLDAALTGTEWEDRILGKSAMTAPLPLTSVSMATGNNVTLGGDIRRRLLPIRLVTPLERPEERDDFKHPDLLQWVSENQPQFAAAGLTVLRAYMVAGRPKFDLPAWGSFEGWSKLIRNCVVWLGLPDPGQTRDALREAEDETTDLLRRIINAWEEVDPHGWGITVARAIELAAEFDNLKGVLEELGGGKPSPARTIAMRLGKFKDRVLGGKQWIRGERSNSGMIWRVVKLSVDGVSGESVFSPSDSNPIDEGGESGFNRPK